MHTQVHTRASVIECKQHGSITIHALELPTVPCCTKAIIRPTDEADIFSNSYNITRETALVVIRATNEYNDRHPLAHWTPLDALNHLVKQSALPTINRPYFAPVSINCDNCGSTFVHHTVTLTVKTPAKHCLFCGSTQITIMDETFDIEFTANLSLAEHYHLSLPAIQSLLKFWRSNNRYTTFHSFMHSDTVAAMLPLLQA